MPPRIVLINNSPRFHKKRITSYFDAWWRGNELEWEYDVAQIRRVRFPRRRARPAGGTLNDVRHPGRAYAPPAVIRPNAPRASAARRRLRSYMSARLDKAKISMVRTLGWGGCAVTGLFRVQLQEDGGEQPRIVFKVPFEDAEMMIEGERRVHETLRRAAHTVQIVDLASFGFEGQVTSGRDFVQRSTARPTNAVDARLKYDIDVMMGRLPVLALEFMPFGDLDKYIGLARRNRDNWPPKSLWLIFQCLYKGCVAMAYPPAHQPADPPITRAGPPLDESPPTGGQASHLENLVHFDLDPQNVLIGNFEETGYHSWLPTFKIGDFGLAHFIDPEVEESTMQLWRLRPIGKSEYFAPEQFTKGWDSCDINPLSAEAEEDTAGHYGIAMNLYQAAQIMWCIITRTHPEHPPTAKQWVNEQGELIGDRSYGTVLLQRRFNRFPIALRELIVRCMSHSPSHRPSMFEVRDEIMEGIVGIRPAERAEMEQWARVYFTNPQGA